MSTLLNILALLFLALFVLIPLIERFAPRASPEQQQRISRWILPLVAIGLVAALIKHLMS